MHKCRNLCSRYKAKKLRNGGRYDNGQKRCQLCTIFIKWDGIFCPCCGHRLRTKPRSAKYKARLKRKRQEQKEMLLPPMSVRKPKK